MYKIFKYNLMENGEFVKEIKTNCPTKILSVKVQNGLPVLYALVESGYENVNEIVYIKCLVTGEPTEELGSYKFLDTLMLNEDKFVFHIFGYVR